MVSVQSLVAKNMQQKKQANQCEKAWRWVHAQKR